jgi:hypothetical protein
MQPYLHIPSSNLQLIAYVVNDLDLADNVFGLAPIINLGYIATYSSSGLTIRDPNHHVVIYGTKYDNVWKFSLPKPPTRSANIVVRHEQSAELVLYYLRLVWLSYLCDLLPRCQHGLAHKLP